MSRIFFLVFAQSKEDYLKAAFDGDSGKVGQLLADSPDLLNEREERQRNCLGFNRYFPLGQATALIYVSFIVLLFLSA